MSNSRIVAYDIECTGLMADFGFLLCAAFGAIGEKKIKLLSLSQFGDGNPLKYEKALVKEVAKEFSKADILTSWFGKGFDRPFLNAKMLEYNLPVLPNIPEVDLYFTARANLKVSRKSLQNIAYYAQVENKKTPVEGRLWKAAQVGSRKALREIEKHNIADVDVLRDIYMRMRPLVRQHPRVNGTEPCKYCGSSKIQNRGWLVTVLNPKRRVFCTDCGGWESRAVPRKDIPQEILERG